MTGLAGDLAKVAKTVGDTTVPDRGAVAKLAPEVARRAPRATGHLAGSVAAQVGYVAVTARYAGYVNYGTGVMAARPFVEPAADAVDWPAPYLDHMATALGQLSSVYTIALGDSA